MTMWWRQAYGMARSAGRLFGRRGGLAQIDYWTSARHRAPLDHAGEPTPWLSLAAIEVLDQLAPRHGVVVELGAGASTLWWSVRGEAVTAYDDAPDWVDRTRHLLDEHHGAAAVTLVPDLAALEAVVRERLERGEQCDVLVSDGLEPRVESMSAALPLLRHDGLLVVDNSDRSELSGFVDALVDDGWYSLRVFGLVPTHGVAHETAFLSRAPLTPRGTTRRRPLPPR